MIGFVLRCYFYCSKSCALIHLTLGLSSTSDCLSLELICLSTLALCFIYVFVVLSLSLFGSTFAFLDVDHGFLIK